MRFRDTASRGFSLTELLLVIGIISLFTSFIIVGTTNPRRKARDARRYADLAQVGTALEAYYQLNGAYPSTESGGALYWRTVCTNGANSTAYDTYGSAGYIPDLSPGFIQFLPTDPSGCIGNGQFHGYIYKSNGADYKFATDWTAEIGDECKDGGQYFDPTHTDATHGWCAIYTPGALSW